MSSRSGIRGRKIYFSDENVAWFDSAGKNKSGMVNMAIDHLKHSMNEILPQIEVRFKPEELEVMLEVFSRRVGELPNYYVDLDKARSALLEVDRQHSAYDRNWTKAIQILIRHAPLTEINAIVYFAKQKNLH